MLPVGNEDLLFKKAAGRLILSAGVQQRAAL